jgi:parvulin-like peptidyl-prolyl isomerase
MIKAQATEKKIDFEKMLSEGKISEQQLRDQIAWQIGWGKFVERELTDARLKSYFDAHQKEFDGTELKVSHIVLRPDGQDSPQEATRLKEMAGKLRQQIEGGKMSFEDAAQRYSAGPSRRNGGDLGYIPRRGLMLEPFAAAAFQLQEGKISEPVLTPYGFHLIKVTGNKPGIKIWAEARDQLKAPATEELFEATAASERQKAKIEFTGKYPHFEPGTKELAD